jgi:hypothetical protein
MSSKFAVISVDTVIYVFIYLLIYYFLTFRVYGNKIWLQLSHIQDNI